MSFNHQSNGGNPPQQGQGQSQPTHRSVPVITPQLLASLNPQQLQQFKSHPQYNEIMRNYMQRQQAAQLMQPIRSQDDHASQPSNQIPAQEHNQQIRLSSGQSQGSASALASLRFTPQVGGQFQANGSAGIANSAPGLAGQNVTSHPVSSTLTPSLTPTFVSGAAGASTSSDPSQIIPHFPADVLSKIPMNTIHSITEWSDKLKADNRDDEITSELTMYESLIRKDSEYLTKLLKQLHGNKLAVEGMAHNITEYNQIKQLRMNAIGVSAKGQFNNSIWGEGFQGYGNGVTNTTTKLVMPEFDRTDFQISESVLKSLTEDQELVPIRLEFDLERDRFKLRDTFLWDLNEKNLSLDRFTRQLLDDYKFIPAVHYDAILSTVRDQINDYQTRPKVVSGELRVPIKIDITINNTQLVDQFEWDVLNFEDNDPEDFASGMCEELCLPGEFATAIVHAIREQSQMYHKALNMVGYAFDGSPIHEDEIRSHVLPSLRLVSPQNQVVDDFFSILRNPGTVAEFTPALVKLTQIDVERLDKEIERESRRKRRHLNTGDELQGLASIPSVSLMMNSSIGGLSAAGISGLSSSQARAATSRRAIHTNARGGPTLPDLSDLPKTFRTPAPSSTLPGAVDLGVPEVHEYSEIYVHKSQVRNPNYRPPVRELPPGMGGQMQQGGAGSLFSRVRYLHDRQNGRFTVSIRWN